MKLLFKNITIYNSKNYNQFIKFHGDKFNFSYNAYTLVILILILYCIVLNIIQKSLFLALLFLFMFAFIVVFRIYLPGKRYQKTKKKFAENKQSKITIDFYKFHFKIKQKIYPYLKLYKIFETKDYFYLYLDEENAILVDKRGFKLGTSIEFADFIKKKCLFKYSKQS